MTFKNKSTLGTHNFIKEFYQDCKSGIATGWWNEIYGRRGERINVTLNEQKLSTVYDLINFIKDNVDSLSTEDIKSVSSRVYRTYPALKFKRVYKWEVDEDVDFKGEGSNLKGDFTQEDLAEEASEGNTEQENTVQEEQPAKEETPAPDFEYAKKIEDKQELKAYAKEFGFKIDSRKSLGDMMKSFQGKFHASKGK